MKMIRIISQRPHCITCGKLLDEWNPFIEDKHQEHPECTGKRIASRMIESIRKELNLNT